MIGIGEKIKTLRKDKHLTQQEVAQRIGVSKAMISSYELESRMPNYAILVKLASLFGVTTDFLLGMRNAHMISIDGLSEDDVSVVMSLIEHLKTRK
ncbi:MAG: helix-turn-helix domain-containing protein [Oscillospiraceae bacterium]|jgi:transcriptional regulator with XRE-family HTH domain|nr:helix-turn-helix domain-containing protein [Oscillospiraceae bacterium]